MKKCDATASTAFLLATAAIALNSILGVGACTLFQEFNFTYGADEIPLVIEPDGTYKNLTATGPYGERQGYAGPMIEWPVQNQSDPNVVGNSYWLCTRLNDPSVWLCTASFVNFWNCQGTFTLEGTFSNDVGTYTINGGTRDFYSIKKGQMFESANPLSTSTQPTYLTVFLEYEDKSK